LNDRLYIACTAKGFIPQHVCEIGVFTPEASNVLGWIENGVKATLVEAHPKYVLQLEEYFLDRPNVTIVPKAVCDKAGTVKLYSRNASSFVGTESSPAIVNDHYQPSDKDAISVEAVTFDQVDDGKIDLLSVDIEGGEWFVIKHMVSRPAVVSVETHGKRYLNPHLKEILAFFERAGYSVWFRDKSDTVFVKSGFFPITFAERLQRRLFDLNLRVRYGVKVG